MLRARLSPLSPDVLHQKAVPVIAVLAMGAAFYSVSLRDLTDEAERVMVLVPLAAFLGAVVGQARGPLTAALLAAVAAAAIAAADALLISRWLLVGGLAVAAVSAPLLGGRAGPQEAWRRLVRSVTAAALALLGAVIVSGGVFVAEISVEALFGVPASDPTATYVVPGAFGLLAPLVFLQLAGSAGAAGPDRVGDALGLVAQTFARLVLVPLLSIYAAVLAAYLVRIAALQALPANEVGWIVPLFGVTGALTYLALAALPAPGPATRVFLRTWFPLTLLPLALYGLALGIRIEAYGVTPQRYAGLLVGSWLALLAIAFTLGGRRSDVRLVPVTAALVLLLGSVGPWSLGPVVAKSQSDRIRAMLAGEPGFAAVARLGPEAREDLCSSVRMLDDLEALGALEVRMGQGDPGLLALCLEPWAYADPDRAFAFDGRADVVTVDGPARIWGPISVSSGMAPLNAEGAALSFALEGAIARVTVDGATTAFDLAALAREQRDEPAGDAIRAAKGAVTLVFRSLHVVLTPEAPRVRYATVTVISAAGATPSGR